MTESNVKRVDPYTVGSGVDPGIAGRIADLVDGVHSAWGEADRGRRESRLREYCVPEVRYSNPLGQAAGLGELADLSAKILGEFPGHRPVRSSGIDIHHEYARLEWVMRNRAGQAVLQGLEVVTFTAEPLLTTITAFFGAPPPITYTYGTLSPRGRGPA